MSSQISTKKRRPKIEEIDVVRTICILAVVLIHATSYGTVELAKGSTSHWGYYILNNLGAFAVPVFLLISGLVLFYNYFDEWDWKKSLTFYYKRVTSIAIPYLVFSLFYYLYNQWLAGGPVEFHPRYFLSLLKWSDAAYHLYYLIIIFQFYIVFPVFITLAKASKWFCRLLLPIGVAIQLTFYVLRFYGLTFNHTASLCVTYFGIFLLGAAIGVHYAKFIAWVQTNAKWIVPSALLMAVLHVGTFIASTYYGVRFTSQWWYGVYNLYAICAGIALLWLGTWVRKHMPLLMKCCVSVGKASFGIYLIHQALLSGYRTFIHPINGTALAYHLYTMGSLIVSFGGAWLIIVLYHKGRQQLRATKPVTASAASKS
ncbi:acyltransferase [Paenibacillus sp. N1-5-1-14]|uniref:acyltransferase n=1 Tax=Paenibacillus radicibacter TaxID=2972488 RepID=UPI0021593439|nr:acyltransferase [Paenibacillus radicibacter]MCR8645005.1 acyltransferase [Paenibacillus radicibacter]